MNTTSNLYNEELEREKLREEHLNDPDFDIEVEIKKLEKEHTKHSCQQMPDGGIIPSS